MIKNKAQPYPLGATLTDSGCYFSIYSPALKESEIQLALFYDESRYETIEFQGSYAGIKSTFVEGIKAGQKYGYLVKTKSNQWQLISDPYAKAIDSELHYVPPYTPEISFDMPKCLVCSGEFDWQGVKAPVIPREEMVIFETHVKGVTKKHPKVNSRVQGKYLGLVSDEMLAFYQENHIKTLQLLPIAACMHEPHLLKNDMVNYWGYNPYLFMAPDPRYAINDAVSELKTTVRELHRNGIEVILDVVYNHTAEAGDDGPIFNLRGLDQHYYLKSGDYYANFTGCGNTLDLSYQPTLNLVMDTLRHWVSEYNIDGFRFDLAATLGRQGEDFSKISGFFMAVAQDPILKDVKLIAEPWDIGPNGYQVGHFPFGWNETNDKLRDISRSFWRGDDGFLQEFATRLMGSRDIYSASKWPFKLTVNYITYHDGFTLQDLVSYKHKHNEENGEQNRDGHGDNRSDNYGCEGPTKDRSIIKIREKQKRNFMATLLFSFGIPHILTADMLSHSQKGNNNAYCQDNDISWLDWQLNMPAQHFQKWLAKMLKARHDIMVPFIDAFSGDSRNSNRVFWRKVDGGEMGYDDWNKHICVALQLGINKSGPQIIYLLNPTQATARFILPSLPRDQKWQVICDSTRDEVLQLNAEKEYLLSHISMAILYFNPKA
ncbi:glycogen debranching protein GlgX [Vibrio viridaestus]|uniref:Glycogen debranching enzyme GlgX n=1 Tax=Vibrio viridaestus TaxID=2487322 RepID=A0A3N9TKX2_9VIBR|nr:glycogen debranching protein GlgX [Vibrio viridaestus]RQW64927.1 glycogen debranching enzyme GlgX [Vibrio viridaestus]